MSDIPTTPTALPGSIRQRSLASTGRFTDPTDENRSSRRYPSNSRTARFPSSRSSPSRPLGSSTGSALDSIREEAESRRICRLCHFTDSANLVSILSRDRGIRSTAFLQKAGIASSGHTDQRRLDGHPDHVCCSIQFPNAWCFSSIREGRGYAHGVVLFIEPLYLWQADTKFCPVNAATASGSLIGEGPDAFRGVFAETVKILRTFTRGPRHPDFLPTNEQAEVLVPNGIPRKHITGVAVRDEAQAEQEHCSLLDHGIAPPPLVVVPEFYEPQRLSDLLRVGKMPVETPWRPQNR